MQKDMHGFKTLTCTNGRDSHAGPRHCVGARELLSTAHSLMTCSGLPDRPIKGDPQNCLQSRPTYDAGLYGTMVCQT